MSTANFPSSMNLANSKKSAIPDCHPSIQRIRSDNGSYGASEICRIEIPCGRSGDWLHPQDSFLEFKVKLEYTGGTAGAISLDGTIMSLFKSLRIYHGSNLLVNQQFANRMYNMLYDVQCNSAERNAGQICLGVKPSTVASTSNNLFGLTFVSGNVYQFSFALPVSLLGTLTDHTLPIGYMGSSSLYLDLEIEAANRVFTTRDDNNSVAGDVGDCTAPPVYTSLTVSEVYYNAKISKLGAEYDAILMNAFAGAPIRIPSVEYKAEQKTVSATTAFSDKFSFQYGSVNNLMWYIVNQETANGVVYAVNNYNSAITTRSMGKLREYYITLNGSAYPTQPISCALNGATATPNHQNGAVAYQHLLRCFNQTTDVTAGGIMDLDNFCYNATALASDVTTKRFIGALSLNRLDESNEKYHSGSNTMGSNFVLNCNWEYPLETPCFLYAFIQHDCVYELNDGLLSVVA
jgi:hypothetical protein